MISCVLQGGLGNQMFQIAAAFTVAKSNDEDYGFDFENCFTPAQGNTSTKYLDNIFKNVKSISGIPTNFKLRYNEPVFNHVYMPPLKSALLTGYFQSEKYFSNYKEDIIKLFHVKPIEFKKEGITTAIHVRRGDYLKHPNFHPTCSVEYYTKAMETISEGEFIFVSDDIQWCKDNFKGDNIKYSSFDNEIDDLSLITECDNVIISNSSFSWWGAYLNQNESKVVIAPKIWFGPDGPVEQFDIIPETWMKI
jgi:hypothetical protein